MSKTFFRAAKLVALLFFVLLSCKNTPKPRPKDNSLIRLIDILPFSSGIERSRRERDYLPNHWKKNPNRYSKLPVERRWQNVQITFNTDENLYINHSQNSIALAPNSNLIFDLNVSNSYIMETGSGILSATPYSQAEGKLEIYVDESLVFSKQYSDENLENWTKDRFPLKKGKKLGIFWESKSSYLFLGNPILYLENSYKKPNVILIVIDAVRRDALGLYGCKIPTSPNLDKLAKESIVFEKAFANANWTKPSMISMFHGDYAANLGITNTSFEVYDSEKQLYYSVKTPNIIRILQDKGYFTASIMNNVFLLEYTGVGVDLGFQELVQIGKDIDDTPQITEDSISFLHNNRNKQFFLHINYNTPHGSYSPPLAILKQLRKESKNHTHLEPFLFQYYGEIRYTDQEIGLVLDAIKQLDLYDDSFIIITSDHGELFGDHHTYESNGITGAKYGHGETHYDEELMIPLIIKPPKFLSKHIQRNKIPYQSSLVSLLPTMLGFLSIPYNPKDYKGVDYSNCILNAEIKCPVEKVIYSEGRQSESIRTPQFKYIRRFPGYSNYHIERALEPNELEELYDMRNDPEENENLVDSEELLSKARKLLKKHSLNKNSFHIKFPPNEKETEYSIDLTTLGGIYQVRGEGLSISNLKKNSVSFTFSPSPAFSEVVVETIRPSYEIQISIYRDRQLQKYKIGRLGLIGNQFTKVEDPRLIASNFQPFAWETSQYPWVYNDSKFYQTIPSQDKVRLGNEIKNILKSWGYIHK
ncbi:MAG: sulfatase [Leptospiraceae bacterium]|nr:sulfatase [Leptospiraceae bacterium]